MRVKYPWISIDKAQSPGTYEVYVSLNENINLSVFIGEKELEHIENDIKVIRQLALLRPNPEGMKIPCQFQDRCHNFHKGTNGNCISEFDDVLDCWVDNTNPETLDLGDLRAFYFYHSYDRHFDTDKMSREEILEEIKRQDNERI